MASGQSLSHHRMCRTFGSRGTCLWLLLREVWACLFPSRLTGSVRLVGAWQGQRSEREAEGMVGLGWGRRRRRRRKRWRKGSEGKNGTREYDIVTIIHTCKCACRTKRWVKVCSATQHFGQRYVYCQNCTKTH